VETTFWPQTHEQVWVLASAFAGVEVLFLVALFTLYPTKLGPSTFSDGVKLVEWERDRVMSAAKGIASTAAGFLVAIATALLKVEIGNEIPRVAVLGCVLGAVGALLLGADLARSTRAFTLDPRQ
jgi:hypothetical protein